MDKLLKEIKQFEKWAAEYSDIPQDDRGGEWECNYSNWSDIWSEFETYLSDINVLKISDYQFEKILYIIARDNEDELIIEMIAENAELLKLIALKGLIFKSVDAKWQIVKKLDKLNDIELAEILLVKYIRQENEYVTRMAINTLGQIQSSLTDKYCELSWNWALSDSEQEYQRMMVLTVLYETSSKIFKKYLKLAKIDGRKHLMNQVELIEQKRKQAGNNV